MDDNYNLELVRVQLVPDRVMVREEPIKTSHDAADLAAEMLSKYDREVFAIININAKGQALNMHVVSIGDLCSSVTHPREVFKSSVLSNAGSVIAIHNHPSGDPKPSDMDIETTRRLCEAGDILGIPILDHIIVGSATNQRYSMKANGDM